MPAAPAPSCAIELGDISVTYVPDGYIYMSAVNSFPGSTAELWARHPEYLDGHGLVVMSLGSLLVHSAGHIALIDLGWGSDSMMFGGPDAPPDSARIGGGALVKNLGKLGVHPSDVEAVLFSHLHSDHTGWIVDPNSAEDANPEDRLTFPNATHYVSETEWSYWKEFAPAGGPVPSALQMDVLASRFEPLEEGDGPIPGIGVMPTPGHTPGHLSFVISSGQDRAVVLGDAVHCPLEVLEPELSFTADVDAELAKRTRRAITEELSKPGTIAAGTHFADLVFGRLLTSEIAPTWHFSETQVRQFE
jgi:glyoxylase-like metal-dependent hydrolase (beta-lactamase superfamily II)